MPEQSVRELVLEHRQRSAAVAQLAARQVRDIALRANTSDIDAWFGRVESDLLALIAAAFEALRRLTAAFLGEHAQLQGVDLLPVLAEWDTEQVRDSLRITGPVAFKQHMTASGGDVAQSRTVMANRLAGSAQRLAMEGERRTVENTIDESAEIVGWRRVSDGDPCAFCAMLISRGAVYKSGRAAGDVAFGGMPYHDNDGCTAVPVYVHEEEPPEVDDLYRQWQQATAKTSGNESLRAWRRYWDENRTPVDTEELLRDTEAVAPSPPMDVPEFAQPYHRDLRGIEDLARTVEASDWQSEIPLTGGVSAETVLATATDGTRVVRKIGGNPAAEQAASLIGRALGLRAPAVYRNDSSGVWMEYISDAQPWDVLAPTGADPDRRGDAIGSDDGKLIGLLDIMTVNADRNAGNWMLTDDGQVIPIDHGHAYMVVPNIGGRPRPTFGGFGPFAEQYWDETGRKPGPNDLTPRDVEVIGQRLEALRPDFELIDRALWLDYAQAVLKAVAPHARGTRDLVGDAL